MTVIVRAGIIRRITVRPRTHQPAIRAGQVEHPARGVRPHGGGGLALRSTTGREGERGILGMLDWSRECGDSTSWVVYVS